MASFAPDNIWLIYVIRSEGQHGTGGGRNETIMRKGHWGFTNSQNTYLIFVFFCTPPYHSSLKCVNASQNNAPMLAKLAKLCQNFASSIIKITLAWKKYTTVGSGVGDLYQLRQNIFSNGNVILGLHYMEVENVWRILAVWKVLCMFIDDWYITMYYARRGGPRWLTILRKYITTSKSYLSHSYNILAA